ncbi:MAG TPA: hypothetical protein ENI62_01135 [Gammaproteobacteria bacterium]|nr:hypothetical protein [Gammaproteobacteria bacterium]
MNDSRQILETAFARFNQRNIPQAEALCRLVISKGEELPDAYSLLGLISLSIGLPGYAVHQFRKALELKPSLALAKKNLKIATKAARKKPRPKRGNRFLLIKAWGFGFWADVDHVLGQLLLAEMTGRTPVVHWGKNSLYNNGTCTNAFELYFDPVSDCTIDNLTTGSRSCFPPKWNQYNLQLNEKNKLAGEFSRMAALYSLARDEDVVVSDFHTYVSDLVPWIDARGPLSGMDAQAIYRYLFRKYLRPKADIRAEIDQYWSDQLKDRRVLAVHVRGSDKISESLNLKDINTRYGPHIEKRLASDPDMALFLLTDSTTILEEYRQKYGERLLYSDCFRTESGVGIHHHRHDDRRRIGIEIIKDTCLASRCDVFIGHGETNVSTTVLHLKDWQPDDYVLLTDNQLYQPHLFLHKR